jgi:uncharacterized protein YjbI with pentapeptide repeats
MPVFPRSLLGAIALTSTLGMALPATAQNAAHLQQLLTNGYCPSCDLSGADLSGLDLSNAYMPGAFLVGANLTNTNLRNANLRRVWFNGANLSGADLSFADLTDASLQGARMNPSANFTGAILDRMVMPSGQVRGSN